MGTFPFLSSLSFSLLHFPRFFPILPSDTWSHQEKGGGETWEEGEETPTLASLQRQ